VATTVRSKEQGADGGQGVAAGRTIQAAGAIQYIEFHSSARELHVDLPARDAVLWDPLREDPRQAATAAGAHSKRYEFPERLFTLLELAVVHRERSFFFGRARGGQELLWQLETTWRSGSVQGRKGFVRLHLTLEECEGRNCSGIGKDVRRERTGEERGT
jgi:hypothetical protein